MPHAYFRARVGGVLQTAAKNMDMMLAGRFFAGTDYLFHGHHGAYS